ncbi:MAG: hypothetical protein GX799_09020, partial [Crenarchaeota archaeon]|nr:hypothetical protein [Thermoproteota archaeon]
MNGSMDLYNQSCHGGVHKVDLCGTATTFINLSDDETFLKMDLVNILWGINEGSINTIEQLNSLSASVKLEAELMLLKDKIMTTNKPVVGRILGPFSVLVQLAGAKKSFRWLKRYPEEISAALKQIAKALCHYTEILSGIGIRVISYADPSLMEELFSEPVYQHLIRFNYLYLSLVTEKTANLVIHLCPIFSQKMKASSLIRDAAVIKCSVS